MKKSRFSEPQIVAFLKEVDAGTPATELARRLGVHANTIRGGRDSYKSQKTGDLVWLKQLENENARMQRIIARQTLELDAVRDLITENGWWSGSVFDRTRGIAYKA